MQGKYLLILGALLTSGCKFILDSLPFLPVDRIEVSEYVGHHAFAIQLDIAQFRLHTGRWPTAASEMQIADSAIHPIFTRLEFLPTADSLLVVYRLQPQPASAPEGQVQFVEREAWPGLPDSVRFHLETQETEWYEQERGAPDSGLMRFMVENDSSIVVLHHFSRGWVRSRIMRKEN